MSFISRKDHIFKRIIDRFELKTVNRELLAMPSVIQPVCDVDKYLLALSAVQHETTTATDATHDFIVPQGKRWHLLAVALSRANASSMSIFIVDLVAAAIPLTSVSSGLNLYWNGPALILDQGWMVRGDFSAGTSGTLISKILVYEENMF